MTETNAEDFLKEYDDSRFPEEFLRKYEPIECLAHNRMGETLLLKDYQTGALRVAKCYNNQTLFPEMIEGELLKKLNHYGLPIFIDEYRNDTMLCVVREYAEGMTLDRFIRNNTLSEAEIISLAVQLCDILIYLHGFSPPIIHRDIKPQNIIIGKNEAVTLIDFGISRTYKKEAKADTVFIGTQEFSPPEQYGFSQTDCRSDIFSLGVVLRWLLTGETEHESEANKIRNKQLSRIVRRCTAFAPKDRYPDASAVKNALVNAFPKVQKRNRSLKAAAGVVVAVLCLAGGIWWHDYNSREIFTAEHIPAYITSEDLVQESVQYLNKTYETDLFSTSDEGANIGYIRTLLTEVFGYDKNYAYAMPPEDPPYPHESESNFFPWGFPESETIHKDIIVYTAVKIFWPDVVSDYSSLKDDNGVYPGVRVAMAFAEENGILDGMSRPADLTFGDVAVILANADKKRQTEE